MGCACWAIAEDFATNRGIDCVISCIQDRDSFLWKERTFYELSNVEVINAPMNSWLDDWHMMPVTMRMGWFNRVAKPVFQRMARARGIYIHCKSGMDRAPMLLIAFMVWMGVKQSIDELRRMILQQRP